MSFTDIFIRRPVLATVISLIIILLGCIAIFRVTIRQYPLITTGKINISTEYTGANAATMEGFVTTPIENAIAGVDGIDYITASNKSNESNITIHLKLGTDVDKALSQIRTKVSSVRWKLPKNIQDPVITQSDANEISVIYFAYYSKTMTPEAISDYVLRNIQPQLQTLSGVGQARMFNEKEYAMRVWLNPKLMAAHHVTPTDVFNILQLNNVQAQAGKIHGVEQKFEINAHTDIATPKDFNNLVVKYENGHLIRLKDIGHAELGAKDDNYSGFYDNKNAIIMGVTAKSNANPLTVAKEIKHLLPEIRRNLPHNLKMKIVWDSSKFISNSIYEVLKTIIDATLLVVLVIFLFLGSVRSVLVPIITIPISLLGACALMYAMGFSINLLTLLAWVLAIGLVVDDAIVVLENIHRHIEAGMKPVAAAIKGAREIRFAVITMTFTLAAVYAPIGLTQGLSGMLFREFAFTLAGAVFISGVVALTLSPMMCSKLLRPNMSETGLAARIERITDRMMHGYKILLSKILQLTAMPLQLRGLQLLQNRGAATRIGTNVLVYGAIIGLLGFLFTHLPQELLPQQDQSVILTFIKGPSTANLHFIEKYTKRLQNAYKKVPEYKSNMVINGWPQSNGGFSIMILSPQNQRKRTAMQIQQSLLPQLMGIPGVIAFPILPPALPGIGGSYPIEFVLNTTGSYQKLNHAMQKLETAARNSHLMFNIDTDLKFDNPQIEIDVNRNKAGILGINMAEISTALNTMIGEPTPSRFSMNGHSYDVIPQVYPQYRLNPNNLNDIYVRTRTNKLIPLANIIHISEKVGPRNLNHFQQLRSATLQASVKPGDLGKALTFLQQAANKLLPHNIHYDFAGMSRQYFTASHAMLITMLFAGIFIFLVLSAQFESFVDPFIILLFSVPLTFVGALLALKITKGTLNLYTYIGLTTLIGLISKHGILMVEFANQLQRQGKDAWTAIIEAASLRLRPILMTTASMVLGALPLAFASGAGAEPRQQIGWVIVGGMTIGTFFTLFIVPIAYTYLARKKPSAQNLDSSDEKRYGENVLS